MNLAPEDSEFARRCWLRALELTANTARQPERTLPLVIDDCAQRFADAPALLSDTERLTYSELAARAHQYGRWAISAGLVKGDVVALMLENSPEYFAIWLGLIRTGVVVALINTQLRGAALAHALTIVHPRHVLAGAEFSSELHAVLATRLPEARLSTVGPAQGHRNWPWPFVGSVAHPSPLPSVPCRTFATLHC